MRIGDVLLASGMSANEAVLLVLRITQAYGLRGVHVDVTFTAMTASYYPAPGKAPITSVRVVRPTEVDYTRVRRVERLITQIVRHGLPVADAAAALETIRSSRHPYPRVVATLGQAGLTASASLLFTTNWKILALTFATGLVTSTLLRWFDRREVPPFFRNLAAAAFVTLVVAGTTYAGERGVEFFTGLDTTLVVVGGIILLLSGTMVVGAVQDAIDQFYLTASARMLEVLMRTGGIVAGIVVGLAVAQYAGVSLAISDKPLVRSDQVGIQFAAAALLAIMFAISVYADLVTIVLCGAMAVVAWGGYVTAEHLHISSVPANTAAALFAAVVTTLLVRRTHVPGFGVVTAALLPLVPGLAIYTGLLQVVGTGAGEGDPSSGGSTLLLALGVAIAIGAGASLGNYFGRPLADTVRRITFLRRRSYPLEPSD